MARLLLTLLAALTVAGCGNAAAAPPMDPFALVGTWRVAGTDQDVLLAPGALEIVVPSGGTVVGTWRADPGGRFVAAADVAVPGAEGDTPPAVPPWLLAAAGFAVDGGERVLTDRAGAEVARLLPGATATGSGSVDPGRAPTDDERRAAGPAAPPPPGLSALGPDGLVGRWVPVGAGAGDASVEFGTDGSWTGTDGCNGTGGHWVLGPAGEFLASVPSVMTLMACDGVDVAAQLAAARTVAVDGDELVLLDVAGAEVGRFARA